MGGSQLLAAEVACSQPGAGAPPGSQLAAQTADGSPLPEGAGIDSPRGEVMVEPRMAAASGSRSETCLSWQAAEQDGLLPRVVSRP